MNIMELPTINNTLIRNGFLVLPEQVLQADLRLAGGLIQALNPHLSPLPGEQVIDAKGSYILPGFIDIHNHGALGFDFTLGTYHELGDRFEEDELSYQNGITRVLGYFLRQGATRILATTLAAPVPDLLQAFRSIDQYIRRDPSGLAAALAGINLEGTFIKDATFAGAQNPEYFQPASASLFDRLQDAAGGHIRIANIPAEHGPSGLDLIRHLVDKGVTVAGGHSGAYAADTHKAIDAGMHLAVHYFNGPNRQSYKTFHQGGTMEAFLVRDEVSLELIVDGYHISPAYVLDAINRKGTERIIAITDSLFVSGSTSISTFSLADIPGMVSADKQYLKVRGQDDTLFGSILTPIKGFSNLLNWMTREMEGVWYRKHPHLPFHDALNRISQMMSGNPAKLLGLDKALSGRAATGKIATGHLGDLIIMDLPHSASDSYQPVLKHCFLAGKMIY